MKVMVTVLSILIILAGLLPFFGEDGLGILPGSIPTAGTGYSVLIVLIGAGGLAYGFANKMVMGMEKMVTLSLALLTILGGVLPFLADSFSLPIPTSGLAYSGLILLIGAGGLVYGFMSLG